MFELVFVACLIGTPDACEERSLADTAHADAAACAVHAPPRLAEWSRQHPGYRIASWHCLDRRIGEFRT